MRLLNGFNKYMAFKVKEIQFRLHTWKRAKEISRAYNTRSVRKAKTEFDFIKIDFGAVTPYMAKSAKIAAVAAAVGLFAFGVVKAVPYISVLIATVADAADQHIVSENGQAALQALPEGFPEDELPEAAILPEGYADHHIITFDDNAQATATQTVQDVMPSPPPIPPPVPASVGTHLADIFRAGMPRNIAEWVILVDKAAKIMYVFKSEPDMWAVARSYSIATGEVDGRKTVEGDKKTPEGEYVIVGRKHRSELTNVYGPAAFILDYPNESDRKDGRTGHGIWIHGSERGEIPPLFTQGCVAVSNPDILDLAKLMRDWAGVPAIIVSGTEEAKKHFAAIDFHKLKSQSEEVLRYYQERQAEFEQIVMDWKTVWESKDIDAYSAYYSTQTFADGAQKWDAYRERKIRTFAMYATINIDISNITLTELTGNSATVKFNQVYATNINRMDNAKRLIFRKDNGNWKIHREIPFPKEELLL